MDSRESRFNCTFTWSQHPFRKILIGGEQNGAGQLVMLGLGEKIRRGYSGIRRPVGYDENLAGARDHVDPRAPEDELAVATQALPGPTILSTAGNRLRPVGHGRHGLGSAHLEDPVDAGDLGRGNEDGVEAPGAHGACHDDFRHSGDPGGDCRHENRRGIGGKPSGGIDAHARQGDNLLAQFDALFPVGPGGESLTPVVAFDAFRSKLQDSQLPAGDVAQGLANLEGGDLDGICGKRHAVKTFRVFKESPVAPFLHVPENGRNLVSRTPDRRTYPG